MNINDYKDIVLPEGDKLDLLFEHQKVLENKYLEIELKNGLRFSPTTPVDIDDPRGQSDLKARAWQITEEIGEAMNCLKNKPWKQTQMPTDKEHFLEEIVDGFHFYLAMLLDIGFTPEILAKYYLKKNEVNRFRQRSGY